MNANHVLCEINFQRLATRCIHNHIGCNGVILGSVTWMVTMCRRQIGGALVAWRRPSRSRLDHPKE